jgi:hypothetical protein
MTGVPKTCVDCGTTYHVPKVAERRSRRCPPCQEEHKKERRLELLREQYQERLRSGKVRDRVRTCYELVYDPCQSWGWHSQFTDQEMRLMLICRCIEIGAIFKYNGGKVVVAEHGKGDLILEAIG